MTYDEELKGAKNLVGKVTLILRGLKFCVYFFFRCFESLFKELNLYEKISGGKQNNIFYRLIKHKADVRVNRNFLTVVLSSGFPPLFPYPLLGLIFYFCFHLRYLYTGWGCLPVCLWVVFGFSLHKLFCFLSWFWLSSQTSRFTKTSLLILFWFWYNFRPELNIFKLKTLKSLKTWNKIIKTNNYIHHPSRFISTPTMENPHSKKFKDFPSSSFRFDWQYANPNIYIFSLTFSTLKIYWSYFSHFEQHFTTSSIYTLQFTLFKY